MTDSLHPALEDYDELGAIGEGPLGHVVAALHKPTGRRIALKYLDHDPPPGHGPSSRLGAQARLWQEIDSAHVVYLYEYVEADGIPVAVLELVDGPSLGRLLKREGSIPPAAALAMLNDILAGLAAAHERGLLHGNLKPENVLLDSCGHAKITDFGVPRISPRSSGNAPYLAPEQRHAAAASFAADLYAAAAVLSRCLTGTRPQASTQTQAEATVPAGHLPDPLQSLIQHGLAQDPAERPQSAADYRAELRTAAISGYGTDWENDGRALLRAVTRELPSPGHSPHSLLAAVKRYRFPIIALLATAVALAVLTTLLLPRQRSVAHPRQGDAGPASAVPLLPTVSATSAPNAVGQSSPCGREAGTATQPVTSASVASSVQTWYDQCQDRYMPPVKCAAPTTINPSKASYECSGIEAQTFTFLVNPRTGSWLTASGKIVG